MTINQVMNNRVMDPIERTKWTTALRSGQFQQGRKYLKCDGYCCLGVASVAVDNIEPAVDAKMLPDQHFGLGTKLQLALGLVNDGSSEENISDYFSEAGYNTIPKVTTYSYGDGTQVFQSITVNPMVRADFNSIADWIDENL